MDEVLQVREKKRRGEGGGGGTASPRDCEAAKVDEVLQVQAERKKGGSHGMIIAQLCAGLTHGRHEAIVLERI